MHSKAGQAFDPSFPAGWYAIVYSNRFGDPFDIGWSSETLWCTGDRQRLF